MTENKYHGMVKSGNIQYTKVRDGVVYGDSRTLYLFGDNVIGAWKGGQAVIRGAVNSFGIVTKRKPKRTVDSYFSDDQYDVLCALINYNLRLLCHKLESGDYDYVYIPEGGFGNGLAEMPNKCPRVFNYLSLRLYEVLGFKNPGWNGKLF